jgi:hypothetical protein
LSIESAPVSSHARYVAVVPAATAAVVPVAAAAVSAPMTIHVSSAAPAATLYPMSDATKLLGIGTLLFGLAAFVRKAI